MERKTTEPIGMKIRQARLPVGIDQFEKLREGGYYYVDKTELIEQVIEEGCEVTLFTRPRRFGKTLNMSMLKYFFEIGTDQTLFDGLYVSDNPQLKEEYMGKFPVIFLSLKGVEGLTFENAKYRLMQLVGREANRFHFLSDSDRLTEDDKKIYHAMISLSDGMYSMNEEVLISSLKILSELLYKHYGKKTILLIDEYDVPLDKAFQNGYYKEMTTLIRGMFGEALKTNDSLQFAVLTGCLRVSKESIFTGLNNFKVVSITDSRFDEQFGFTDEEVQRLLADYHLKDHIEETKEWYDGYLFGNIEIYNPWSTLMYVDCKLNSSDNKPISFWANTSGNDLVVNYIQNGSDELHEEFEQLIQGKTLTKYIKPELTYREMDNINNIYSFPLLTGYLKIKEDLGENKYKLIIPNKEVYEIYKQTFMSYFEDYTFVRKENLYQSLVKGDVDHANEILGDILSRSISYFDNEESFYHGFLLGLFSGKKIKSNREAVHGRFDLCIFTKQIFQTALILECKHSKSVKDLIKDSSEGAQQIIDNKYEDEIINDGYLHVKGYGISFYKKYCYIVKAENS